MKTSIIGYPRIGRNRELKFATESFFNNKISLDELLACAKELRTKHWLKQKESGIDYISSGDFSFYDNMLDLSIMLGIIPKRYLNLELNSADTYFALAKGYQGEKGDVKALSMRKWFNTNYHYLVPEIDKDSFISLNTSKLFNEFNEAKSLGILTKPSLIGPLTFLKLAKFSFKCTSKFISELANAYVSILKEAQQFDAEWIQIDEPILVTDLTQDDINLFKKLYTTILKQKGNVSVLLQTYFGDIRDIYTTVISLNFDGIGIDFVEGKESLSLIERHGFRKETILFAGLLNGKNIWRNNYDQTLKIIERLKAITPNIVINSSCSLLHVPYTVSVEDKIEEPSKQCFAFAEEKLIELTELALLAQTPNYLNSEIFKSNAVIHSDIKKSINSQVNARIVSLTEAEYERLPKRFERFNIQRATFNLPLLPTTTIGSFPQTDEVRSNRTKFKKNLISYDEYVSKLHELTASVVKLQEDIGLDVLVHGEFERGDMVEYFGENLDGFLFTQFAWVQSYGTRCVKPPIVFSDISRPHPITVETSKFAQSLTAKPMKGMLTGPITILNWSFPREDISYKDQAVQIALAIRDEVLDLEKANIKIIQIDEAALREKLPLRKSDWRIEYLDWAIPTFRLTHSGVSPETQIHTHMCYSEFQDIIADIDAMDADVITFEASRSSLEILDAIIKSGFQTAVGPGVYDIHSPRIPSEKEIIDAIKLILKAMPEEKVWVNPDCGLKTRKNPETLQSLINLVSATIKVRKSLK
ncbi:MAG: 5-methyltetrahydropteroyltriglutamate--homocysteine S-methyltransferase [Christensenellaceae bacterium]|jgi:5-methyltetrahydropteroyltriglutamate--homocysteine methyltransferase|nr:5-methyltetrahydropteroyltriglutamate--homocysteine S-methyltransferase [Christensenellaceae bacterium]